MGSMLEGIADLEVVLRGEIEGVSILHERRRGQQKPWLVVEYREQWRLEDVEKELCEGECTREGGLSAKQKTEQSSGAMEPIARGGEREMDSLVTFHEGSAKTNLQI